MKILPHMIFQFLLASKMFSTNFTIGLFRLGVDFLMRSTSSFIRKCLFAKTALISIKLKEWSMISMWNNDLKTYGFSLRWILSCLTRFERWTKLFSQKLHFRRKPEIITKIHLKCLIRNRNIYRCESANVLWKSLVVEKFCYKTHKYWQHFYESNCVSWDCFWLKTSMYMICRKTFFRPGVKSLNNLHY